MGGPTDYFVYLHSTMWLPQLCFVLELSCDNISKEKFSNENENPIFQGLKSNLNPNTEVPLVIFNVILSNFI